MPHRVVTHHVTTMWVEKDALKALRVALAKRVGSNTGITKVASEAIRRAAKELEAKS